MGHNRVVVEFNSDGSVVCEYIKNLLEQSNAGKLAEGYLMSEALLDCWSNEVLKGQRNWAVGIKAQLLVDKDLVIYAEVLSLDIRGEKALVWIPNEQDLPTDKFTMYSEFQYGSCCAIDDRLYEIPIKTLKEYSSCINGEACATSHEAPEEVATKLYGEWADYAEKLSEILCKDIDLYQQKCLKYAKYPESARIIYPTLGLTGEAGEVSDKVKKVIRDSGGEFTDEIKKEIMKELGDVLWYCATLAHDLGFSLSDVAFGNIKKLESRFQRNKIGGSGDNR